MINNDILRSLRYCLDLSDKLVTEITQDGGIELTREELDSYLLKEGEDGVQQCPDSALAAFLNGLIIHRRGQRGPLLTPESRLDNNLVLKKLRIAFALRDDDIVEITGGAGSRLSRSELKAVFQKPGHKNYKPCGNQLLRQFLAGLVQRFRTAPPEKKPASNIWKTTD